MAVEIERKYLVCGDFTNEVTGSYSIKQGYLTGEEGPAVRIRTRDNQAFITIKKVLNITVKNGNFIVKYMDCIIIFPYQYKNMTMVLPKSMVNWLIQKKQN